MEDLNDIQDHLLQNAWRDRFEDEVLFVGQKLKGKVRALNREPSDDNNFIFCAEVHGEHCEVSYWKQEEHWNFESTCSCEIRSNCPHAVALLTAASKPAKMRDLFAPKASITPASSHALELKPEVHPPSFHLQITREPTDSKLVRLLLQALKIPDQGEWVVARPIAIYGDHRVPLGGKPGLTEYRVSDRQAIRRDGAAEMNAIMQLQQIGLTSLDSHAQFRFLLALEGKPDRDHLKATPPNSLWFPNPSHGPLEHFWPWLRSTGRGQLTSQGWSVHFHENVGHEVILVDPEAFKYTLIDDGGGSWFHLSVGFDVAGKQLDLLPILAQLLDQGADEISLEFPADGNILHHLDDGRALSLPADRIRRILKQFSALIDPRRFKGSKLQLHPLDAATLVQSDPEKFTPPETLTQLIASLTAGTRDRDKETQVPQELQANLRDYQLTGFQWMQFLARHELHGILADDMGLGKTLQTITHILAEKTSGRSKKRPTLVVAPTSVVPNWYAEIKRFAPSLSVLILDGPQRRKYFRSIPHADVILTSFALIQRDIENLLKYSYHFAILDEAQYIKNPSAKVSQAVCKIDARHRLCLSGTPIENHLGELWSLMRFLMPGFLGSHEGFKRLFVKPIEEEGDRERQQALKERVAPLILRRTKDQVAKELPPKTIIVHPIELNTQQKDLYE
ncbi:MAG: DEAD/DEAH box helicase, partial [Verrucomicrobiales bacterium]